MAFAVALAVVIPAPAAADSTLTLSRGEAVFRSDDAGVANRLAVEERSRGCTTPPCVRFHEPEDPLGINAPLDCTPGGMRGSYPVEVFCPRRLIRSVRVDIGPGQDRVLFDVPAVPAVQSGDTGADVLEGGDGDDVLHGEQGDDRLAGGAGADTLIGGDGHDALDGGEGDDTVDALDGRADTVACGPGDDAVVADAIDHLTDCERVDRRGGALAGERAPDVIPPRLAVGGPSAQSLRGVAVRATSSEPSIVQMTGFLAAGGWNRKLAAASAVVPVGGGGVTLRVRPRAADRRAVRRDLARGRRPRLWLTVSAVDDAGNTSRPARLTIELRR
jgi:hypothetical protein